MRARSRLSSAVAVIVTGSFFIATISPALANKGQMWASGTRRQQQQTQVQPAPSYGAGAGGAAAPRRTGWFNRTFPKGTDKRAAAIGAAAGAGTAAVLVPHAAAAAVAAVGKGVLTLGTAGLTAGKVLVGGLVAGFGPIGAVLILGGGAIYVVHRINKGRQARNALAAQEEALMAREADIMQAESILAQRAQELGAAQEALMARGAGGAGAASEAEEAEALARERAADMGGAEEALAAEEAARRANAGRGGARNAAAAAEADEIAREAERLEAAMAQPEPEPVVRSERQRVTRQPAAASRGPVMPQTNGAARPAAMVSGGQLAALERKAAKQGKQLVVAQPRLLSSRTDPRTGTVREDYIAADGITLKVSTWRTGANKQIIMKDVRVYKDGKLIPELSWQHKTDDARITTLKDGSKMRTSRWRNGKTKMQDVGMRDSNGTFMGSIRSRSPKDVE